MEMANNCHASNVVCDGSPSRMRRVRRISLGMTTLPRSSILLTMPVAFIYQNLLFSQGRCIVPTIFLQITPLVSVKQETLYRANLLLKLIMVQQSR